MINQQDTTHKTPIAYCLNYRNYEILEICGRFGGSFEWSSKLYPNLLFYYVDRRKWHETSMSHEKEEIETIIDFLLSKNLIISLLNAQN